MKKTKKRKKEQSLIISLLKESELQHEALKEARSNSTEALDFLSSYSSWNRKRKTKQFPEPIRSASTVNIFLSVGEKNKKKQMGSVHNASKFELLRLRKEHEIKTATTYKSYDDSNIESREQVKKSRHNDEQHSHFHSSYLKYSLKGQRQAGWMGDKSVPVARAASHTNTIEVSRHFPANGLLPAMESMEAIQRTFTYKITKVQHLNYNIQSLLPLRGSHAKAY